MARVVTVAKGRALNQSTTVLSTVVVRSRRAALAALDGQTKAIVGKPSREAFRLLDAGKFRGTIAEVELTMLRDLTA